MLTKNILECRLILITLDFFKQRKNRHFVGSRTAQIKELIIMINKYLIIIIFYYDEDILKQILYKYKLLYLLK